MLALIIWPTMKSNLIIFFDLDGTLLDTAPDLYSAMLETLAHFNRDSVPFDIFRPHVHTGTKTMILACFDIDDTHPEFPIIREIFLKHYQRLLTEKTDYFPGMEKVLGHLDTTMTPWGIVTSKPGWLTEPLLKYFELDKRSQCIVSGDTVSRKKPYPDPLLHACKLTQTQPQDAIYIGDTEIDVQAAKAAGMIAIAALYGYRKPDSRPEEWEADYMIESPLEILNYL